MTRPWLWNLVLLLALVLAGSKLLSALTESPPPLPQRAEVAERPFAIPSPRSSTPEEAYDEIAERNLFSSGRGKTAPPEAKEAPPPVPQAVAPPKATLFGIVMDDGGNWYAYMTDDSAPEKTKPKRYREGDTFADATVKEIRPDRVVLAAGQREHTVSLRAPKAGIEAYQPPAPPPGQEVTPARRVPPRRTAPQVRSRRQLLEESRRARSSPVRSRLQRVDEDFLNAEEEDRGYRPWPEEEESFYEEEEFYEELDSRGGGEGEEW